MHFDRKQAFQFFRDIGSRYLVGFFQRLAPRLIMTDFVQIQRYRSRRFDFLLPA